MILQKQLLQVRIGVQCELADLNNKDNTRKAVSPKAQAPFLHGLNTFYDSVVNHIGVVKNDPPPRHQVHPGKTRNLRKWQHLYAHRR